MEREGRQLREETVLDARSEKQDESNHVDRDSGDPCSEKTFEKTTDGAFSGLGFTAYDRLFAEGKCKVLLDF